MKKKPGKKPPKQTSDGPKEKDNGKRWGGSPTSVPCKARPNQILRACAFRGKHLREVLLSPRKGKLVFDPSLWSKLQKGQKMGWNKWVYLGRRLKVAPWTLCEIPSHTQPSEATREFAARLRELIERGDIPVYRKGSDQRLTDVVSYVWQMQDWVLDQIKISYIEQAEAFRLLCCDKRGCLIEQWDSRSSRLDRIGVMNILTPSLDQIQADLATRDALTIGAFRLLSYQKNSLQKKSLQSVRARFSNHLDKYEKLADRVCESTPTQEGVDALVDADYECRATIFHPGEPEKAFRRTYGRSKRLIDAWMRKLPEDFGEKWPVFVEANGRDLREMFVILKSKRFNVTGAIDAAAVASRTLVRTEQKYIEIAPKIGLIDPTAKEEAMDRKERSRSPSKPPRVAEKSSTTE